jgi:RNA polymerase sigma factor (sigma-70 family)
VAGDASACTLVSAAMDGVETGYTSLQDEALLSAWCEGDKRAGDVLLDRHFPALLRFFNNKAFEALEDLVQETMLECVRSAPRYRASSTFRTFLFAVANNVLKRYYRSASRSREAPSLPLISVAGSQHSPLSMMVNVQEQRLLLRALKRLPLEAQVILELKYWEGLSSPEISEVLGVPAGTIRTRQMNARMRLQAELERLAESRELATSTLHGFDTWVARVRDEARARR